MRLTPPTKYVYFSSVVLVLAALALYLLEALGLIENVLHFAFWTVIAGWLAMTVGVASKGV